MQPGSRPGIIRPLHATDVAKCKLVSGDGSIPMAAKKVQLVVMFIFLKF